MSNALATYLVQVAAATAQLDEAQLAAAADVLFDAWRRGATVHVMGNGGSAALASHMATDLGKNTAADLGVGPDVPAARRLRITAVTDNVALITALGNDIGYDDVFVEQLKGALRAGDVVVGISGSGSSPNVVRAMQYARRAGATTIALTSARPSAAAMLAWTDCPIVAPTQAMEQIEDLHTVVNHALTVHLRERIASAPA